MVRPGVGELLESLFALSDILVPVTGPAAHHALAENLVIQDLPAFFFGQGLHALPLGPAVSLLLNCRETCRCTRLAWTGCASKEFRGPAVFFLVGSCPCCGAASACLCNACCLLQVKYCLSRQLCLTPVPACLCLVGLAAADVLCCKP